MSNIDAQQFSILITNLLTSAGVSCRPVVADDRRLPRLPQGPFLDLDRSKGNHAPDLLCTSDLIPYELKGSQELYDACHFSRAHLCSYLLQTIYGQCFSYADLFRASDAEDITIILAVSGHIQWRNGEIGQIDEEFQQVLESRPPLYIQQMNIGRITFTAPEYSHRHESGLFGTLGSNVDVLVTRIKYTPNQASHLTGDPLRVTGR